MKNLFTLTAILLFTISSFSQDCKTYALHRNMTENMEYFASLNPNTGEVFLLDSIPDLEGVQMGFAATNSRQGHYYFYGITESYDGYFYTMSLADGSIVNMVDFPPAGYQGNIIEMHYHPYNNLIYALHWDEPGQMEYLISIDPITANITKIDSLPEVQYIQASFSALNYQDNEYTFMGVDFDFNYRLFTLDINSGEILHQPITPANNINGGLNELEVNPIRGNLYALHYNTVENKEYFTRINNETGEVSILSEIPEVQYIQAGFSALNPQDGIYYFNGIHGDNTGYIYSINIYNGEVVNQVNVTGAENGNLKELQFPSLPPVVLSMSNTSICHTDSVLIQAPEGFSEYQWSNGSQEDHIYVRDSSSYQLSLSRNYGCSSYTQTMPIQMYDCNDYAETFTQYHDTCLFSESNLAMSYLSDIQLDGTNIHLNWNFVTTQADSILIPASYDISENGLYELRMVFSCNDKADDVEVANMLEIDHLNPTGTSNQFSNHFSIYPNPTSGDINVVIENSNGPSKLKIYNQSNQLVMESAVTDKTNSIDTHHLANGVYIIVLENDSFVKTTKLIKN